MSQTISAVGQPAVDTPVDVATASSEQPPLIGEDWLTVLVGGALIVLVLAGLRPALPRFSWGAAGSSLADVVSVPNLARTVQLGMLVLVPLIAGAFVLRARMQAFVPGVIGLYALAWLA